MRTYYTIWDGLSQKTISGYCPFNVQCVTANKKIKKCSFFTVQVSFPEEPAQIMLLVT
jgi:hypothetical protein